MARAIVFLMAVPCTEQGIKRLGVPELRNKGIAVHVMDLSYLLHGNVFHGRSNQGSVKENWIYRIDSYSEFERKVSELAPAAVFVDYLVGFLGIDLKHEKVFRILKKYDARYYIVCTGDLPTQLSGREGSGQKTFQKFLRRFNMRWFSHYIERISLRLLTNWGFYPVPAKVFGTRSENMENFIRKYNQRVPFIPINSYDYDIYCDYVNRNPAAGRSGEKTCVFVDDAQIFSYDFDIQKSKKLDGRKYLNDMNLLFDRIEKETGLEVVIAAHPISRYEEYPGAFRGRKIVKGKTVELVAGSRLVVGHLSTAISYAVLFNKPILFVKTDDMERIKRDVFIDAMADALGLKPLNINDPVRMEGLPQVIKNGFNDKFNEYKHKYLVSPGSENLNSWDIVAEEVKKEPSAVILQDAGGDVHQKTDAIR